VGAGLRDDGVRPAHIEGLDRAEWVLLDYFDFIVHVFGTARREFYALERLWGSAGRVPLQEDSPLTS
jgi:ribosome-associated protein